MDGAAFRVFCFATADSLGTRSILRFAISENASIDIISAGSTPHTAVVAGSTTYAEMLLYHSDYDVHRGSPRAITISASVQPWTPE